MNKEIKEKWIKALRSGQYKQGRGKLKERGEDDEIYHCCLGVLCELHSQETNNKFVQMNYFNCFSYISNDIILSKEVVDWSGLSDPYGTVSLSGEPIALTKLNDDGSTFEEIAQIIEEKL